MNIVVYTAVWCGPSRTAKGLLRRAGLKFKTVDIQEEPNEASAKGIQGVPTTVIYSEGEEVKRFVGCAPTLVDKINRTLKEHSID